jgi:DNA invertase Pin-like site-specific DNA recombinase
MKRIAIYYRVSTTDQNPQMQMDELREYAKSRGFKVVGEYLDEASGRNNSRRQLEEMLKQVRKRKVDVVLVWKYDRFARSTQHLVNTLEEFKSLGIDFISYTQQIDTTTSMGKFFFTIMAGIAEFESDIISERVRSGMAAAKRKGKHVGRPHTKPTLVNRAQVLRKSGKSIRQVAKELRISPATVQKYCRAA